MENAKNTKKQCNSWGKNQELVIVFCFIWFLGWGTRSVLENITVNNSLSIKDRRLVRGKGTCKHNRVKIEAGTSAVGPLITRVMSQNFSINSIQS